MLQVLANFLSTPLASGLDGDKVARPYVAFDLNPGVVKVKFSRWGCWTCVCVYVSV